MLVKMKAVIVLIMAALMSQVVEANNNTFINNEVKYSDYGIHIKDKDGVTLTSNVLCDNTRDIYVENSLNVGGSENVCGSTTGYNDSGASGCAYSCPSVGAGGAPMFVIEKPRIAVEDGVKAVSKLDWVLDEYGGLLCFMFVVLLLILVFGRR